MDPEIYTSVWRGPNQSYDVCGTLCLTRVTHCIFENSQGESAGAMSAALHMVTNGGNTEGLFRAAFMVRVS